LTAVPCAIVVPRFLRHIKRMKIAETPSLAVPVGPTIEPGMPG
jgi:hypothetical protein